MRENPPVKVVGGLGRPFCGSGWSKYPFNNYNPRKHTEIQISGPMEFVRTPRSVGHPGWAAYRTPDQPPEVATMLIHVSSAAEGPTTLQMPRMGGGCYKSKAPVR